MVVWMFVDVVFRYRVVFVVGEDGDDEFVLE